jgi:hypothetical protein
MKWVMFAIGAGIALISAALFYGTPEYVYMFLCRFI